MKMAKKESAGSELIKNINRELIIRNIVKFKEISRADLSRNTGLALPSVMRITDFLIEKGVIAETGQGESTGGRKPNLLTLNGEYKWIIGVEIASNIIITLANFAGIPVDSIVFATKENEAPSEALNHVAENIQELLTRNNIDKNRLAAVGVGTPGSGFKHQNTIKGFISKGWESIDVTGILSELTSLRVIADNVCRTRTLSEIWFGRGRTQSSFIYAFVDWGVGIGIVDKGFLIEGSNGVAGEFGHLSIDINGKDCYCGKRGCVEMYTSVGSFASESGKIDFDWIIEHQHEEHIKEIIKKSASALAFALANVINLINPPVIILGGLIPRALNDFTQIVETEIKEHIFHSLALDTPIVKSEVDNETICLGSIALVIHNELMERL